MTTITYDSAVILRQINTTQTEYNTYNNLLATYNTNRIAYDKAVTDEKARQLSFNGAYFTPPIKIPVRPCPPS